jgi:hypothetical protein
VIDAFMMFTVLTGFVFCAAYIRAEYLDWRQRRSSDVEKKIRFRLLHDIRSSRPQTTFGVEARINPTVGDLAEWRAFPSARAPVEGYLVIAQPRAFFALPIRQSVLRSKRAGFFDRAASGVHRWME